MPRINHDAHELEGHARQAPHGQDRRELTTLQLFGDTAQEGYEVLTSDFEVDKSATATRIATETNQKQVDEQALELKKVIWKTHGSNLTPARVPRLQIGAPEGRSATLMGNSSQLFHHAEWVASDP